MKKLLLTLALLLAPTAASAQCNGIFSAGQVCGANVAGPPGPISGVSTNVVNTQTVNYTIQTSDCGKIIQLGTGSTGLLTLTVPSVTGFPSTCSVVLLDGDNGRGKIIANDPGCTSSHILSPLQSCEIGIINGAWTAKRPAPIRWKLPGLPYPNQTTFTWHVNGTSGNDSNDGLATGSGAFKTCQYAMDFVSQYVDVNGQNITLSFDDTTQCASGGLFGYNLQLKEVFGAFDYWPGSTLAITGNVGSPVTWNCGSFNCIEGINIHAGWIIQGFAFTISGSNQAVVADAGTHVYIGANTYNGSTTQCPLVSSNRGFMEQVGTQTINLTGYLCFAETINNGGFLIASAGNSIVMNSTVAFTFFYYDAGPGGFMAVGGVTYSGTGATASTGTTFGLAGGAGLLTSGKCASTGGSGSNLPGNVAGVIDNGFCDGIIYLTAGQSSVANATNGYLLFNANGTLGVENFQTALGSLTGILFGNGSSAPTAISTCNNGVLSTDGSGNWSCNSSPSISGIYNAVGSLNSNYGININNTNSGSSANSGMILTNNSSHQAEFILTSSGHALGEAFFVYVVANLATKFYNNNSLTMTIAAGGGLSLGSATNEGADTINIAGAYYQGGTIGVTCSGSPTASFASKLGIVTHC